MNKKIFELAEQAGFDVKRLLEPYPGRLTDDDFLALESFAELIIQQCIEQAGEPADGLILGNTWHDGVRASVWSIKQHFGVEE